MKRNLLLIYGFHDSQIKCGLGQFLYPHDIIEDILKDYKEEVNRLYPEEYSNLEFYIKIE